MATEPTDNFSHSHSHDSTHAHEGDFEALYEESLKELHSGTVVTGRVVEIRPDGIAIDIGYKSEGVVPLDEFTPEEMARIGIGIEIPVFIERIRSGEGVVILSHRKAHRITLWDRIEESFQNGTPMDGTIVSRAKGGMFVDIEGAVVFLPGSHMDIRPVRNPEEYIGMRSLFLPIKVNKARRNAIVSRRIPLEEERRRLKEETVTRLIPGTVMEGVVKNLTDYGAFVDLGGIDGLLHVSDMSWGRIHSPSERVTAGERITVKVINFDPETEKVTLGLKQLVPDPWETVEDRYLPGDKVSGLVMGLAEYGAFVEVEEGVEGLVHVSEIRWGDRPKHPSHALQKSQMVEAAVLRVDASERRLSLSIKRLLPNPWETIRHRYREGQMIRGVVRNFADFGTFVGLEEGIDGLIHVSDMSWTKHIRHPSEILRKGQEIEVVILSIDPARERISLGLKQLTPDPWTEGVVQRYKVGETHEGRVIKHVDFGIFIELAGGVEGLVYASEIPEDLTSDVAARLAPGHPVRVRVIKMDPHERKIGLRLEGIAQPEDAASSDGEENQE